MKRLLALCLIIVMCFALTGCDHIFGEANTLLKAPTPEGEYQKISAAIKASKISGNYSLKSAKRGNHRSSFIIVDGTDNALAFFSTEANDAEELHMVLLTETENEWKIISDTVLNGTDIEKLEFADFNGDGLDEVLIATNIYGSPELRLSVYDISAKIPIELFEGAYTEFLATTVLDETNDYLIIINLDTLEGTAECNLLTLNEGSLKLLSSVQINPAISAVTKISTTKVDGKAAIYIDAKSTQGTYFTEVVYYDKGLVAPLSNDILTSRYENTISSDIDQDGVLEIPTSTVLPGDKNALNLTEWYKYTGGKLVSCERSVLSASGGYRLTIQNEWQGKFTCVANEFDGLDFYEYGKLKGEKLFSIRVVTKEKQKNEFKDWSIIDKTNDAYYIVKVHIKNSLNISEQTVIQNVVIQKG